MGPIPQAHRNDLGRLCSNVSDSNSRSFEESQRADRELFETGERLRAGENQRQAGNEPWSSCSYVSDTNGERWNTVKLNIRRGESNVEGCLDRWGGRFDSWWEVEPGMGRLVDGATDWVDKLRILGNGVVPQQAAHSLQILGGRLACGIVAKREPKG